MSQRVLIIPDKFKGTLTSDEAGRAIARGWRKGRPQDKLTCLPISDGGDGFGAVLSKLMGGRRQTIRTVDAAHRLILAHWWWVSESSTAIIESAGVIGLSLLPPGKFHPFDLDTSGLAAVLKSASKRGARQCIVGIGGSATNDGGFGVARALGWEFFTANGSQITSWVELDKLRRIESPGNARLFKELIVAVDVQNPLLGLRGASHVYGPQKGLRPQDLDHAESCLRQLARVMPHQFGDDKSKAAGAGAAGGLGFGLMAFAGAKLLPGFDLVARKADLKRQIRKADLVITGEGSIDSSTLMGKGVGEVAQLCRELNVPCIGLCGRAQKSARVTKRFLLVRSMTDITSSTQAMKHPAKWLENLAALTSREVLSV